MRITEAEKAKNRALIIETASRLFRERGVGRVSIADLMREAGFTHGGFYNHFASKEALTAAVCELGLAVGNANFEDSMSREGPDAVWKRYVEDYLSPAHRDGPATGCTLGALLGEVAHETSEVQCGMLRGTEESVRLTACYFARRYRLGEEAARRRAIAAWTQMLGALSLSRAVVKADRAFADEILAVCREQLTR